MGLIDKIMLEYGELVEIKEGGQKKVYKGKSNEKEFVIIKRGKYDSLNALERIKREIDFLKQIDSKFFPKNYNFQVDINNNEFIIIEEYIKSIPFNDVVNEIDNEEKLIKLVKEILVGFNIIWQNKIVHRDIKPDNVLFQSPYKIVIIDLGIARFKNKDSLTNSLALLGPCTPIYAAPEQLNNSKSMIDLRTDFFSIGILLSIIRYGTHPFDPKYTNPNNNIVENILNEKYLDFRKQFNSSIELAMLFDKLLAKQPYQRFRNFEQIDFFINKNWG